MSDEGHPASEAGSEDVEHAETADESANKESIEGDGSEGETEGRSSETEAGEKRGERIESLEAKLGERDQRVEELESELDKRDERIEELEQAVHAAHVWHEDGVVDTGVWSGLLQDIDCVAHLEGECHDVNSDHEESL